MNKKLTKRAIFKHIIFWIILYCGTSIAFVLQFWKIRVDTALYNYLSLVTVSYLVRHFASQYFAKVSFNEAMKKKFRQKFIYYLFRAEVFKIMLVAVSYILLSWVMDKYVYHFDYPYFWYYCDGRWTRESLYVLGAVGVAFYQYKLKKYRSAAIVNKLKVVHMQKHLDQQREDFNRQMESFRSQVERMAGEN
jgi:hypothetical protein